ncbi:MULTISPECIES: DUF6894 family protein [unclassified Neorhizobium]|uniref:DUF6894 family protein n=1 Tax=unclassified Neorhizobium TaxID=2629175 RepID=UPI001FF68128|nr:MULTISPECIES: hypothetical protein [unclassified Neorhizobium]MCJ9668518.1 hypothetical protein [Neorhizobium sp. SHOUNA12B]MCJ9744221.1 hypothetical protein [Neorhizobium sp. SHOUNA12A]
MQRFYLHLNYLHDFIADPDGSEYPDLQTARFEALQGTRDLAADCLRSGEEFKLWSVRVCNADGDMLDEIFVQEALGGIIPVSTVPSASTVSTI